MRILVIDNNYPSPSNLYGDVFAHVRVKQYCETFNEVLVAAYYETPHPPPDYNFEGVNVRCVGTIDNLVKLVEQYRPDRILIHFATYPVIQRIVLNYPTKYIVWVHGFEALGWYRRLFNFNNVIDFAQYIRGNIIQLYWFRRMVRASNQRRADVEFVFVSNWMRKITETDCVVRVKRSHIIPNPINEEIFYPEQKPEELRKQILMIRPFTGKKYGTDIVTDALLLLRRERPDVFSDLRFTFFGGGALKSRMNAEFAQHENVSINEGFLTQAEIKKLHSRHGTFIVVSRQDAQGVSMCEAMSSGLVPISSNNTAIPEFIQHNYSGILTDNAPRSVMNAIIQLYESPSLFQTLSANASEKIIRLAGMAKVIPREVDLINC